MLFLNQYHNKNRKEIVVPMYGKKDRYPIMGIEIEMELPNSSEKDREAAVNAAIKTSGFPEEKLLALELDGSLLNGCELITQPLKIQDFCSLEFKSLLSELRKQGFKTNSRTGLHIHADRFYYSQWGIVDDAMEASLNLEMGAAAPWLKKLSRRESFNYCRFNNVQPNKAARKMAWKKDATPFLEMAWCQNSGHHAAINYDNKNTIEFRFFGGTLDWVEAITSIQFVAAICSLTINSRDYGIDFEKTYRNGPIGFLKNIKRFEFKELNSLLKSL